VVGSNWSLDETYVNVKGCWKYPYLVVDKAGATADFPLTAKRDRKAALRFLREAINQHGAPENIAILRSDAEPPTRLPAGDEQFDAPGAFAASE
jgi:putative transposase